MFQGSKDFWRLVMPAPLTPEPKASETPRLTAVIERHPRSGATIGGAKKQMHKLRPEVADPKDAKSPVASLRFLAVRRRADGGTIRYRDLRSRRLSAGTCFVARIHQFQLAKLVGQVKFPCGLPPLSRARAAMRLRGPVICSALHGARPTAKKGLAFGSKRSVCRDIPAAKALPGRPLAPAIAPIRG